jgi:hypothetical protein
MVDYVEVTDSIISELKGRPTFSEDALTKAASALAGAALISDADQEELIGLFRDNPDKALESITKIAAKVSPVAPSDYSLGAAGDASHTSSRFRRESDRVLYEKLGLV